MTGAAATGGEAQRDPQALARQWAAYEEVRPKSIIELQPFRAEWDAEDAAQGLRLHFVALNPAVDAWFLLQATDARGRVHSYHLENPDPAAQSVRFETTPSPTVVIRGRVGAETFCRPWADGARELAEARRTALPYAPVCNGRLFLRNKVTGSRTTLEATAEFLRDNIWGGEDIVRFVRDTFFKDLAAGDQPRAGDRRRARRTGPRAHAGQHAAGSAPGDLDAAGHRARGHAAWAHGGRAVVSGQGAAGHLCQRLSAAGHRAGGVAGAG
ncbi:hypothetical protein ACFOHS_01040 [Jhaorihella thermophila]